ncbi:hypothetical protein Xen7305DRAFT_00020080 [Xenococcus sp. PCC 7305]|nr:hypothetical protein [Xenococcus sp. PCC 7305]ELS02295.1 hypothetical protein Xen7305DRAFT_00020080 [Xenococcus sp. PCC 7305]
MELAITRVALRVASGGHNIPEDVIRRRYDRGRKNFLQLYGQYLKSVDWKTRKIKFIEAAPTSVTEEICAKLEPLIL